MMQHCTSGTKYSISGYDSRWFEQIWCILEVLNFFTIDLSWGGHEIDMTSGQRYKKLKYTNCRHLYPYCTMRVSKSSDHWCALGTMSNFEKRNLRSGHLIRPGHVTFGVSGSSFFGNVSNCLLNSSGKFGGATRRRFLAICEKPYGGLKSTPPAGARVNRIWSRASSTWWDG